MGGNATVKRFILNNLVIGAISAADSLEVAVTITAPSGVGPGDVGIAVPRGAAMTGGVGINPVRVASETSIVLQFVNGSAAPINPADTFDFDVYIFTATGGIQQTI